MPEELSHRPPKLRAATEIEHLVRAVDIAVDADADADDPTTVTLYQYPDPGGSIYVLVQDDVVVSATTVLAEVDAQFEALTGNPPAMPDHWYTVYRSGTDLLDSRSHAERWYVLGLHPETAATWARLGWTPGEAEPWTTERIAPDAASHLAPHYATPKEARDAGHTAIPIARW